MSASPRVAVLIPAKDAATTIARAIRSALLEPETAEVLVVDDGSTDNTAEAAWRAAGASPKVRVLQQTNAGPSAALNRAHGETRSEFICVLDADDFFTCGRLGRLLKGDAAWEFAADRLLLAEEGREDGPHQLWDGRLPASGRLSLADFVIGNITDPKRPRTELGYLQPLYRRAFIDQHAIAYNEHVRLGEDYLFYTEALARGAGFKVIEDPGYVAVQRASSLSHRHHASDLRALLDAEERLLGIPGLNAEAIRAMRRHIASTRARWIYHLALEAKAKGKLPETMPTLFLNAASLPYAMQQTISARLKRLTDRGPGRSPTRIPS